MLSISRVKLIDLSGINAFASLKEIYASFNSISNLNDFFYNGSIEVLDLEGNEVDEEAIEVLETMSQLKVINLTYNPITKDKDYKEKIKKRVFQLEVLDDNNLKVSSRI